jgi:uncharacterized protein
MKKNNLNNDSSPYLQQHKNNPVNWQIWSKDILNQAKLEKKPMLLSIGYASCHWCHVMAHESFEDKETAEIMNKNFINIKVDREERPDIDFIYQSSYQLFNRSGGGWPLTIFLDENAIPFMCGTYFPKEEKHGLPSFKEVLNKVSSLYFEQREKIVDQSKIIKKSLELKKTPVLNQDLEPILESLIDNLDPVNGGYKNAPKFPSFNVFETLLYFYNKTNKEKFLKPIELILKKISSQGIYDHVEGGISRYTVDEKWLIPHFEKMLYDNAQFILLLSKFVKIKPDMYFKNKITQTIDFFEKNFLNKELGLMGSALDADSENEEGKYYTFSYEELSAIKDIKKYFDINPGGNWEGKIILRELSSPTKDVIDSLKKIRNKKIKPFFDNKTQLDLNSIWVSALLHANNILPEKKYLKRAEEIYQKINHYFFSKKLFHSNSKSSVFLEDYAYSINMLLDLYDSTLNSSYKIKAMQLSQETSENFYINEKSVFQKNIIKNNDLFISPIDISDHTIPNGNSIMLTNFTRLGLMKEAEELSNSLNGFLNLHKTFMVSSLKSIDFFNQTNLGKNCNEDGCSI